jgi:hypothetical protein
LAFSPTPFGTLALTVLTVFLAYVVSAATGDFFGAIFNFEIYYFYNI